MFRTLLLAVALALPGTSQAEGWLRDGDVGDASIAPEIWNSPDWVLQRVRQKKFDRTYRFITRLNPFYLRGDFNGDGKPDFAVLIERVSDQKQGIAIFHFGENVIRVMGAGNPFSHGGDDFSWMDVWQVYPKGPVEQGVEEGVPPKLGGEALWVEKSESASAIIYWDRQKYVWYHQGD